MFVMLQNERECASSLICMFCERLFRGYRVSESYINCQDYDNKKGFVQRMIYGDIP